MSKPTVDLRVPSLELLHQRRSKKWASFDPDVLSMTVAEMDFPIAPVIRDALIAAISRSDLGYPVTTPRRLRAALVDFSQRRLNWTIDPEQITVIPDVMFGIVHLCSLVAGKGGRVAFATPGYPPFSRELTEAGLHVTPIGLNRNGMMRIDELDAALRDGIKALVLTNPHNPTGRVLPRAEMDAIAERCAEHGVCVIADEIHAPLVLPGTTHVPWLEVSDTARRHGIALTSASKAFNLAALKTAFIVTAEPRAEALVQRLESRLDHASLLGEIATEVAFRDSDDWLDAVIDQLDRNRTSDAVQTDRSGNQGRYRLARKAIARRRPVGRALCHTREAPDLLSNRRRD